MIAMLQLLLGLGMMAAATTLAIADARNRRRTASAARAFKQAQLESQHSQEEVDALIDKMETVIARLDEVVEEEQQQAVPAGTSTAGNEE